MNTLPHFICIFCLLACTKTKTINEDVVIDELPSVKIIESQEICVPAILLRPVKICIVDSFLIVGQFRPDSIFNIFKLPECEHITSFGNRGRGPNEFFTQSPQSTLNPVYNEHSTFAVGNMRNNIRYYRIHDILKKNITPYKIEMFPPSVDGFQTIGYFSDTLIIGAPYRLEMLLFKYDSKNKQLYTFKDYPNIYSFQDLASLRNVYSGFMTVKPDNSKFALAYGDKGIIEIYNPNNNTPITVSYKGFPSLEDNLGLNNESKNISKRPEKIFCWGIKSSNRFIYARIYNENYSNISDGEGLIRSNIAQLHVFDWSGKIVARLKPDYFYTEFDVEKNDQYLYTIDDNKENIIRRYDIYTSLPR